MRANGDGYAVIARALHVGPSWVHEALSVRPDQANPETGTRILYFITTKSQAERAWGGETVPVKVGIARSVEVRLRQMACYHWEPLVVLVRSPGFSSLGERMMHRLFAHKRIRAEWFDLSMDDICAALGLPSWRQ